MIIQDNDNGTKKLDPILIFIIKVHAQQSSGRAGVVSSSAQGQGGGQPSAQVTPAAATASSSVVAPTSTSTLIKMEQSEVAEAETMDIDLPFEHPSAATGETSSNPLPSVRSPEMKMEIEDSITSTESISSIPFISEDGDLPFDLVKAMFRDLDASQKKGDGDVSKPFKL